MSSEPGADEFYLSARYVGDNPDEWLNGPDALLGDMADWWMSNGKAGRWPDGGFAHFTVTTVPEGAAPEAARGFRFSAVFPHRLLGTTTAGCLRPASQYVPGDRPQP